jgi:hypothetical protein
VFANLEVEEHELAGGFGRFELLSVEKWDSFRFLFADEVHEK